MFRRDEAGPFRVRAEHSDGQRHPGIPDMGWVGTMTNTDCGKANTFTWVSRSKFFCQQASLEASWNKWYVR